MIKNGLNRRAFLKLSAGVSVGVGTIVVMGGCSRQPGIVCNDPATLSSGEMSLRKSLNYREQSADVSQQCSGCAFFTAETGNCGSCQILNGPANPEGHCDSWAAS